MHPKVKGKENLFSVLAGLNAVVAKYCTVEFEGLHNTTDDSLPITDQL